MSELILRQVGPRVLLGWVRHYFALAAYTLLHTLVGPLAARSKWRRVRRWADAWRWGSGHDYAYHSPAAKHDTAHSDAADSNGVASPGRASPVPAAAS